MLSAARAPGESLPPRETLRRGSDCQRCYRSGARRQGALVTLHFLPNEEGCPRLGITASRKVGDAVARHRLKRWTLASRMREYEKYVDGVQSGKVGKLTPSRGETPRGIALRISRAGKRMNKKHQHLGRRRHRLFPGFLSTCNLRSNTEWTPMGVPSSHR